MLEKGRMTKPTINLLTYMTREKAEHPLIDEAREELEKLEEVVNAAFHYDENIGLASLRERFESMSGSDAQRHLADNLLEYTLIYDKDRPPVEVQKADPNLEFKGKTFLGMPVTVDLQDRMERGSVSSFASSLKIALGSEAEERAERLDDEVEPLYIPTDESFHKAYLGFVHKSWVGMYISMMEMAGGANPSESFEFTAYTDLVTYCMALGLEREELLKGLEKGNYKFSPLFLPEKPPEPKPQKKKEDMSNLELIAEQLRENGFSRQATLLESFPEGMEYTSVLLSPFWEEHVRGKIGDRIYNSLQQELGSDIENPFSTRDVEMEPLRLTIDLTLTQEEINQGYKFLKEIVEIQKYANREIFRYVKEQGENDPDILHNAYDMRKGYDAHPDMDERELRRVFERDMSLEQMAEVREYQKYRKRLWDRTFGRFMSPEKTQPQEDDDVEEDINVVQECDDKTLSIIDEIDHPNNPNNSTTDNIFRPGAQETLEFLDIVEAAYRKDPEAVYQAWKVGMVKSRRESAIGYANEAIERALETGLHISGPSHEDKKRLRSFRRVLQKNADERREIVGSFERYLSSARFAEEGMRHILEGGTVTEHFEHSQSIFQNPNKYPNIEYSEEVHDVLRRIVQGMQNRRFQIPNMSGLKLPSSVNKLSELVYTIRELPKDPLDVSFGNDAGACIAVPTEEDPNPYHDVWKSVPKYLSSDNVRLFGVYRQEGSRERRVGMMLGFEMNDADDNMYLALNSYEFSDIWVGTHPEMVSPLVDYVDSWMEAYAKEADLAGVSMKKNTRHSWLSDNEEHQVEIDLRLAGVQKNFFSDILTMKSGGFGLREGEHYWVWKKE